MFYIPQNLSATLTLEFDFYVITVDNLFEDAFVNNGMGNYNIDISFPNLRGIIANSVFENAFKNNSTGRYYLNISFPNLEIIQGNSVFKNAFVNNSSNSMIKSTLNFSAPQLNEITGTNIF